MHERHVVIRDSEKILEEKGYVEDLVHYRAPNPPRSRNPPH